MNPPRLWRRRWAVLQRRARGPGGRLVGISSLGRKSTDGRIDITRSPLSPLRILMCCYDQRGLGRAARTLDIASALAGQLSDCAILVLSNLSIIGRFRAPMGVDVIRLPSVGPATGVDAGANRPPLDREA